MIEFFKMNISFTFTHLDIIEKSLFEIRQSLVVESLDLCPGCLGAAEELLLCLVPHGPGGLLPVGPRLVHGPDPRLPVEHEASPTQQHRVLLIQAPGPQIQTVSQRALGLSSLEIT